MEDKRKPTDMRQSMPKTAEWVNRMRAERGAAFVNGCIKAAMAGVPGRFYAIENGYVLGTPFAATEPMAAWQNHAVCTGTEFAGFMANP